MKFTNLFENKLVLRKQNNQADEIINNIIREIISQSTSKRRANNKHISRTISNTQSNDTSFPTKSNSLAISIPSVPVIYSKGFSYNNSPHNTLSLANVLLLSDTRDYKLKAKINYILYFFYNSLHLTVNTLLKDFNDPIPELRLVAIDFVGKIPYLDEYFLKYLVTFIQNGSANEEILAQKSIKRFFYKNEWIQKYNLDNLLKQNCLLPNSIESLKTACEVFYNIRILSLEEIVGLLEIESKIERKLLLLDLLEKYVNIEEKMDKKTSRKAIKILEGFLRSFHVFLVFLSGKILIKMDGKYNKKVYCTFLGVFKISKNVNIKIFYLKFIRKMIEKHGIHCEENMEALLERSEKGEELYQILDNREVLYKGLEKREKLYKALDNKDRFYEILNNNEKFYEILEDKHILYKGSENKMPFHDILEDKHILYKDSENKHILYKDSENKQNDSFNSEMNSQCVFYNRRENVDYFNIDKKFSGCLGAYSNTHNVSNLTETKTNLPYLDNCSFFYSNEDFLIQKTDQKVIKQLKIDILLKNINKITIQEINNCKQFKKMKYDILFLKLKLGMEDSEILQICYKNNKNKTIKLIIKIKKINKNWAKEIFKMIKDIEKSSGNDPIDDNYYDSTENNDQYALIRKNISIKSNYSCITMNNNPFSNNSISYSNIIPINYNWTPKTDRISYKSSIKYCQLISMIIKHCFKNRKYLINLLNRIYNVNIKRYGKFHKIIEKLNRNNLIDEKEMAEFYRKTELEGLIYEKIIKKNKSNEESINYNHRNYSNKFHNINNELDYNNKYSNKFNDQNNELDYNNNHHSSKCSFHNIYRNISKFNLFNSFFIDKKVIQNINKICQIIYEKNTIKLSFTKINSQVLLTIKSLLISEYIKENKTINLFKIDSNFKKREFIVKINDEEFKIVIRLTDLIIPIKQNHYNLNNYRHNHCDFNNLKGFGNLKYYKIFKCKNFNNLGENTIAFILMDELFMGIKINNQIVIKSNNSILLNSLYQCINDLGK